MILVSQNKERVMWFGQAFNALEYSEQIDRKGRRERIRHTICISDGCLDEVAEYATKERCLEVLREFCKAYEDGCYTIEPFDFAAQSACPPVIYINNTVFEFPKE